MVIKSTSGCFHLPPAAIFWRRSNPQTGMSELPVFCFFIDSGCRWQWRSHKLRVSAADFFGVHAESRRSTLELEPGHKAQKRPAIESGPWQLPGGCFRPLP